METASSRSPESSSSRQLRALFASGRPLLYIVSAEEQRVGRLLRAAARQFFQGPVPLWTWSLTEGMRCGDDAPPGEDTTDARAALDFIARFKGPAVFHLKDFHEPLRESAGVRRRLRDAYELCLGHGRFVVISSPVRFIPDELGRDVACLEFNVPDFIEIRTFLDERAAAITAGGGTVDTSEATLTLMTRALQGLTLDEAGFAIRRALADGNRLGLASLPVLFEEKRLAVNRSGTIECIADGGQLDAVGGLEVMKRWLLERRVLFESRDSIDAELVPKGVLVMGVSGCGKSLSVKAIAGCFQLPLYRIDMAEIFSGRHGPPEWAFAQACRTMEAVAPAVVWFDEIELGITSAATSGEQGRIFAFFLTWMQEKVRGLFVAATANRIDLLPAEMIRKGRFDEVFFVDLPRRDERLAIFRIHLERRGADPSDLNIERLVDMTDGWTGAEVEQCVVSAITRAKLADHALTFDDLMRSAARTVPLSKTMKEKVDYLRNWARDRAVSASLRE
jgi:ATPase family protein associated with various cellular activities (AAA)